MCVLTVIRFIYINIIGELRWKCFGAGKHLLHFIIQMNLIWIYAPLRLRNKITWQWKYIYNNLLLNPDGILQWFCDYSEHSIILCIRMKCGFMIYDILHGGNVFNKIKFNEKWMKFLKVQQDCFVCVCLLRLYTAFWGFALFFRVFVDISQRWHRQTIM